MRRALANLVTAGRVGRAELAAKNVIQGLSEGHPAQQLGCRVPFATVHKLTLSLWTARAANSNQFCSGFRPDAFFHLSVFGHTAEAQPLLNKAGLASDAAVVVVTSGDFHTFLWTAKNSRIWKREPRVGTVF